jgi:hypothetical protein
MAAVAGLRSTGDFGTDERPKDFREMIMFRNPNGASPLYALTSRAKKRIAKDPEFNWWDEPNVNVRLQSSASHGTSETTINVDSVDPSGSDASLQWGLATHLKPGDLLRVEATETTTHNDEIIRVVQVLSATQFVVERGVAGSTAITIGNDAWMTLMGSAYAEGTPAPQAVSRNPIKFNNYTQIFKDTYELTGTADKTSYRTGNAWSNDKKRKTFDHARGIEWSMLYGQKFETVGANGKPLRYMGGLRDFIPASRTKIYSGTTTTVNTLLDDLYPMFDYETGGGDERIAFCGNTYLNTFNKMIASDTNSDINYVGPVKVFGFEFSRFRMPQGSIYLRSHPLMNVHGKYTASAFYLDFDSIRYVTLEGRDTKSKDDVQAADEDVRRGFFQTECSMQVDRGGLTMAYHGNFVASVIGL